MSDATPPPLERLRLTVRGIVQGVGFRPWTHALARQCGCSGFVRNDGGSVTIEIQGTRCAEFLHRLQREAPPAALITELDVERLPVLTSEGGMFRIAPSDGSAAADARHGGAIPPDLATCPDCRRELFDEENRRFRHPFISCTNCGPRFTITATLPYDRPGTSMRDFPMCAACAREYGDPAHRRHHAQPIACHDCGPVLRVAPTTGAADADPVAVARRVLRDGGIVAVKGLGGYHLAVDARNVDAVQRLRARKHRDAKPFAVMAATLGTLRRLCRLSVEECRALESPGAPIVLADRLDAASLPGVAPGIGTLGVMLPSTPVHHLLLHGSAEPHGDADLLVMTSGNVSDEPICIDTDEAELRLRGIADVFLHHDRAILQRCDDSVVRMLGGELRPLRRARGAVPRPVPFPGDGVPVLAAGAELKSTVCITAGCLAHVSQHLGDLSTVEGVRVFEHAAEHLLRVFGMKPRVVAHDLHPEYLSTRWALGEFGGRLREALEALPRTAVQHHHAHAAACLAENGITGTTLCIVLDGTGYGPDGTLWGGEFLAADLRRYERLAHLHPVPLPGGERAIREPWRTGAALLADAFGGDIERAAPAFFERRADAERGAVRYALAAGVNAPLSSGMGRLIDGFASLLGVCDTARYEAEAAMRLEALARDRNAAPFAWDIHEGATDILSFQPAVAEIVQCLPADASSAPDHTAALASRAHATIVAGCADMARRLALRHGFRTVALSGGVFQNRFLFEELSAALERAGLTVLSHRLLPCNDAGISYGQAVVARARSGN